MHARSLLSALLSQPCGHLNICDSSQFASNTSISLLLGNDRLVALAGIFSEDSSSSLCRLDVRYSAALNTWDFSVLGGPELTWDDRRRSLSMVLSLPEGNVCPGKA